MRLFFFYIKNDFCRRYLLGYVQKYRQWTQMVDLTERNPDNMALAKKYGVTSVPTLLLMHPDGQTVMMGWHGGRPPNMNYINVEIGMSVAYGQQPKPQD